MKPNSRRSASDQTGFTLVEIMVGLAIGMLATVVIIQVITVFEAQRRTTTGSADAQTNGGIAMYNIGRELRMAGYPLIPVPNSSLECTTLTVDGVADTPNRLSPVTIVDGAGGSDTITIRYGNAPLGGAFTQITLVGAPAANDATVGNNFGCQVGDISLITNGSACAMSSVSAISAVGTVPPTVTLANLPTTGNLSCLGTTWNEITYAVNNVDGNLERNGDASVVGVVSIQAQYGVSEKGSSNKVIRWVNAKNIADWSVGEDGVVPAEDWGTALTAANRNRIKAVRIAVVARNAKMEPGVVTSACSSITAAAPTGLCAWDATSAAPDTASPAPTIDLSADDANWGRYRYRVFETIIPLRNMIWSKDTL